MRWIVIRRRSSDRLAAAFPSEPAARAAMEHWQAQGFAMELIPPGGPVEQRPQRLAPAAASVTMGSSRFAPFTF